MAFCAAIPTRQILAPNPGRRGAFAWNWIVATVVLALNLSIVRANPAGGSVSHGNATIDQNGNTLTIHQGTDLLIMGWHSFSIGQGETTRFVQPSSSSMALNRVTGGTRSMIEGRLEANGGVILINPAGITVTKSGVVNVNTFIGSTHDITDDEFLKGGALNFKGTSDASVENLGTIHAETGDIALIARTVRNEGTLSARKGVVGLAAGDEVLYQPNAEERLLVKSQTASASSIHHSGSIQAAAAEIKAAGNPYAVAINLDGIVEARGNATRNIKPRVIVHAAQGDIKVGSTAAISAADESGGGLVKIQAATGNLQLDGKVAVNSSMDNEGKGGEIQILGNTITLSGTALLDASGATGGGKIFVGGDYQGGANPTNHYASEPLQNASTLRIDKGAVMNADATVQGDGGVVINWADGTTVSSGSVSVRGGPLGGNGGFVEISGKQNLGFDGAVDLAAIIGKAGQVLFDPGILYILNSTTYAGYPSYILNSANPIISANTPENYPAGSATLLYGLILDSELNKISAGTINLFATAEIRFINAYVALQNDVNLVFTAPIISVLTTSSIAALGTGYITLNASSSINSPNLSLTTASGAITLNSPLISLNGATFTSTAGGAVSLYNTIYTSSINPIPSTLGVTATSSSIQITPAVTPTPAPTPSATPAPTPVVVATPSPTPAPALLVTPAAIVAEPTVQTSIQSLTIRNNTTTTSSGGSFGSSGPSSESSGSSGESASAGETASAGESASSGESSSSESGGETASSESSGESASSSESSTASTDSGSSANTASADASSSSGSTSTANSSSSSASAGSAATASSSGGSSQGAKTQAAAISRMNNPVGGATVGGAEFQRLNPFSDAGAMHQEVAGTSASSGGGTTQTSTGRAAAVSVKSPEMTELAPMNDLNVLFMMF